MCEALTFLLDNIYIRFGFKLYRQMVGMPMGTKCSPIVDDLFLFCYERDFMLSLSEDTQSDGFEAFSSTSRYLDDLLKSKSKPNQPRLRFDLEKLRDRGVACTFQETIGGKFAPLIGLSDEDMGIDIMITTYNTAVTDAASEILGKECRRKKPWVTKDVLDLCDERRDLNKRYETEGAKEYREANRRIQKAVKKAKEDWIGAQCEEIETFLNKINSKRAYQLVKDLTSEKQGRSLPIQNNSGKCLTEEKDILSRWTEYCPELYNYESCGDNAVLDCSQPRKKICNQTSVRKLRLQ